MLSEKLPSGSDTDSLSDASKASDINDTVPGLVISKVEMGSLLKRDLQSYLYKDN